VDDLKGEINVLSNYTNRFNWVEVKLTCPKGMDFDEFKEIIEDSVKELGSEK